MRIVSLTCSNTEIVCALGCADLLVGVDDHSDYPVDVVAGLPRVGPDLEVDIGRVAALRPDLVLASLTVPGHERVVEQVERAGLSFIAPAPESLADVYGDIHTIAKLLGVEAAGERVVGAMRRALVAVSSRSRRPRLLVEWWPKPTIAPGRRSWVNDLLELAGARNPFGQDDVKSRPLSDQEVLEASPDAFVLSWCGVAPEKVREDVVYRNPLWQQLDALRLRRVFRVPEALLGRPSPRLVDGYHALRRIVDEIAPGESVSEDSIDEDTSDPAEQASERVVAVRR